MNNQDFRILAIDDEEFNRNLMLRLLKKKNYNNIDTADNGNDALNLIRRTDYDAILLDIEMPSLDGMSVLRQLQQDMRLREIPVIIISGSADNDEVIECIKLGAVDFLPKPVDPVLLHARLGACLEKKRLRDRQSRYIEQLREEKKRADQLLGVILPSAAMKELKSTGSVPPRSYDDVAILFCDIAGFTAYCEDHSAEEIVNGLQELFEEFEAITLRHGMEKIKTIGDEFMAAAGLSLANNDPLLSAVACGLDMVEAARKGQHGWGVRVGINQGPVVAGIVGRNRYQYDVWGKTVNIAARITGIAPINAITMPASAWMLTDRRCDCRSLGMQEIKGVGQIEVVEAYALR